MTLGTSRAVRVFAYPEPVDLRKGYDGLFGLVKAGLARDPLSGDLFLFVGKRRNGCKGVAPAIGAGARLYPMPSPRNMTIERATTGV